jgi:asparagine synthase (glutamine-hydrolysing)
MCGIAGVRYGPSAVPRPRAIEIAAAMAKTLAHRGPDDDGAWESADGAVALAHRRLSVIDLSPIGRNPMLWDGGRLALTFNGEIYNFLELRRELESHGHRFRSSTDTEVVLAAYDQWGLDAVHRLAGMFAFALWDEPRRRLWLVRDRLGKKPLYYCDGSGTLHFGSELKALLVDPNIPRTIDRVGLRLFLKYGYVPAPYSIFSSIRKLEPGHTLVSTPQGVTCQRYWDPVSFARPPVALTIADAEAELEHRLTRAVDERRIADVPLCRHRAPSQSAPFRSASTTRHSTKPTTPPRSPPISAHPTTSNSATIGR